MSIDAQARALARANRECRGTIAPPVSRVVVNGKMELSDPPLLTRGLSHRRNELPSRLRGLLQIFWILVGSLIIGYFAACSRRVDYRPATNRVAAAEAINVNTATAAELEKLPHIGRKTAESIVEFREQNGPFRRVEHLMQIRGISEERFRELRPFLKIE